MDAKTMAAAAGAAGVAAAIACSKTCAADAGGGDTVRHLAPLGIVSPRQFLVVLSYAGKGAQRR